MEGVTDTSGLDPQAGEGGLVEDHLEPLVAPTHPTTVAHPLAGVTRGGYQSRVGGEVAGAREGERIADRRQEFGAQARTHARQAEEYLGQRVGGEPPLDLAVELSRALLEGERPLG